MRAQEFVSEATEFVLYVNGKPATKYQDLSSAQQDIMMLKQSRPGIKLQLKQEVCKLVDVESGIREEKVRLDPKCWTGKKIGNPKTKIKGGVRVNNCVPAESVEEAQLDELSFLGSECTSDCSGHRAGYDWSSRKGNRPGTSPYSPSFNKGANLRAAGR